MKETIAYLETLLKDNDTLVIGLSGGPDSMCLFDILTKLDKKLNIICAHINHNIRPESVSEAEFVKDYLKDKNATFETITFDKKSEDSNYTELELREKRYAYFEELIKKYNAKYLLTAHHGDDLIETILMRMTRGSNLKGYAGFQVITKKETYDIIRPLIFTTKDDINKYNKLNNIPSVIDKSNNEDEYTRNRYRHTVLPFLKSENKNVHLKYLKFSKELMKYYEFVDKTVSNELHNRYNNKTLDIKNFNQLDNLIKTKMIESILDDNYEKNLYLVSDRHINIVLNMIKNPKPNITINLPDSLEITKSYNKVIFTRTKEDKSSYNMILKEVNKLPNNHTIRIINETEDNSNEYIRLDTKELAMPLIIRTRQDGDKMIIKNMNDYKKIKDIFINSKIPQDVRDTYPIVVDSQGKIVWLPGLRKSNFAKAKNENYDIILWYN